MADALRPQTPMNTPVQQSEAARGDDAGTAGGSTISFQAPQLLMRYRKVLLFAAASLMLAGFLGLMMWSSETPYRPVYSGMSEKDAAAVVDLLQKDHIPYRLEGAGTVLVPADQVYQARLKLAGDGVAPQGNTGFEIFDKTNEFGLSDFTRKINLQRAMQGELARTIEVLPQVNAARVHLVMPKESAFAERDRKASASVMLQLSGGQRLSKSSVTAIQNLVAASVAELDPSEVTVVDSSGTLLSVNEKEAPMSEGQTLQEYQAKIEQRMENSLTGMLEQIVGQGQAVVRVSADIDRQFVEQNNTRYNPDEQVLRSQKTTQESHASRTASASASPAGVPGIASNTPGANPATAAQPAAKQPQTPSAPTDQANRTESVNNYEISTTHEHRVVPFGNINKLSVAVIVGGSYSKDKDGKEVFTPKTKQQLANIQTLVQRAIGYDEDRGDTVDVQSMPLMDISSNADAEALASSENKAFYLQLARYGVAGLALVLLTWFVLLPLARRISNKSESESPSGGSLQAAFAANQISEQAYTRLANMEMARHAVHQEPDRAGRVLREWVDHS